jgi:integrase
MSANPRADRDSMGKIHRRERFADFAHTFPYLKTVRAGDRATEFHQRCVGLGIKGISLHSYRYAWAERAKTAGYPERFAQEALGQKRNRRRACIQFALARVYWKAGDLAASRAWQCVMDEISS